MPCLSMYLTLVRVMFLLAGMAFCTLKQAGLAAQQCCLRPHLRPAAAPSIGSSSREPTPLLSLTLLRSKARNIQSRGITRVCCLGTNKTIAMQLMPVSNRCWHSSKAPSALQPCLSRAVSQQRCQALGNSRRDVLMSLSVAGLLLCDSRPSQAEPALEAVDAPAAPAPASPAPTLDPNLFQDDDYTYYPPMGFDYIDIPFPRNNRPGPAPERSPIRSRFEAKTDAGNSASVSVAVRNAQALGFSFTQVNDISAYGPPDEAAKLLVPRGSILLKASSQVITLPPRETPVGTVDIPPKAYYLYEFITPQNDHIIMSAAAARGKVYVCGGAAPKADWASYAAKLIDSVKSFRLL